MQLITWKGLANARLWIVLKCLIAGIGYGLMFGPSMVMIGLYFKKYASAASGLAVAGGSLGQLALPHFINFVSEKYAFRGALLMYSALMLHAIPATMLLRPPAFYDPKGRSGKPVPAKVSEINSPVGSEKTFEKKSPVVSERQLEGSRKETANAEKQSKQNGNEASKFKLNGEGHAPRLQFGEQQSQIPNSPPTPPAVVMRPRTRFWLLNGELVEKRASLFLVDPSRPSLSLLATSVQDLGEELRKLHQPETEDNEEEAEAANPPRSALGVFCRKCCDPVLLRDPVFAMFALGLSFGHGGYITTCLFVAPFAYELWNNKSLIAVIISVIGVADLVGRIGAGFFAGLNIIRKSYLVGGSFLISGVCTVLMPFVPTTVVFFVYAAVLGMLGGTYMAQIVVQIIELFGPALLASGLGLSTMFMGLFVIPIPPTLGQLAHLTMMMMMMMKMMMILIILIAIIYMAS